MGFRFKVQRVNHLKDVGIIILDGIIESGKVFVGSEGALAVDSSRRIKITGVGMVSGKDPADPLIPLFIAPPDFPLSELDGAVIVGD
jgi:hypothetical protein